MSMLLDISILVTCHNKLTFLDGFADQIKNLRHFSPEIIIVDDFSTDGSYENLVELLKLYPEINLSQNQTNLGSAASRNLAIDKATREYIFFWDIDDHIDPSILSVMLQSIKIEKVDLCRGTFVEFESQKVLSQKVPDFTLIQTPIAQYYNELANDMGYWRYLYSLAFLKRNRIVFFPTNSQLSRGTFILDDVFFMIQIAASVGSLSLLPNSPPVYFYSTTEHSYSSWKRFQTQAQWFPRASLLFLEQIQGNSSFDPKIVSELLMKKCISHMRYLRLSNWLSSSLDFAILARRLDSKKTFLQTLWLLTSTFNFALRNSVKALTQIKDR